MRSARTPARGRVSTVLALGAALGACVIPTPSRHIVGWGPAPDEGGVILPVLPSDVRVGVKRETGADPWAITHGRAIVGDEQAIAGVVNEVLDEQAGDPYEGLVGPRELSNAVAKDTRWEYLRVYLDDPGPLDAAWKRDGLTELAELLGRSRVVRVRTEVVIDPTPPPGDARTQSGDLSYSGAVLIEMELVHLQNGEILSTGRGRGTFWLLAPAGSIIIFREKFRTAVDHAVRAALTHLFHGVEQLY